MATLEGRISRLEGILEQMNERLGAIERRLDEVSQRQDEHFRWLLGIILVQWITVLAAIMGALLAR